MTHTRLPALYRLRQSTYVRKTFPLTSHVHELSYRERRLTVAGGCTRLSGQPLQGLVFPLPSCKGIIALPRRFMETRIIPELRSS